MLKTRNIFIARSENQVNKCETDVSCLRNPEEGRLYENKISIKFIEKFERMFHG